MNIKFFDGHKVNENYQEKFKERMNNILKTGNYILAEECELLEYDLAQALGVNALAVQATHLLQIGTLSMKNLGKSSRSTLIDLPAYQI